MPGFFDLGLGDVVSAATKIFGGKSAQDSAEEIARQNIANQRDFAQNAVSWKVADARRSGISPLAALGASTSSFSNIAGSSALGDSISDAGQDLGRAVNASQSGESRQLMLQGAKLDVEKKGLENDILRADLASKVATRNAAGSPPAMNFPQFTFDTSAGNTSGVATGPSTVGPLKVEEDTRQSLNPFGYNWKLANTPDSQAIENRYGDPVEWVYGMGNLALDTVVNSWPAISRFYDASGLARPVDERQQAITEAKFRNYLKYLLRDIPNSYR